MQKLVKKLSGHTPPIIEKPVSLICQIDLEKSFQNQRPNPSEVNIPQRYGTRTEPTYEQLVIYGIILGKLLKALSLSQQSLLGPSCSECMEGSCVACDAPCEESVEEHTDVEFLSISITITFNHIVIIAVMMHLMRRIRHGVRHC